MTTLKMSYDSYIDILNHNYVKIYKQEVVSTGFVIDVEINGLDYRIFCIK